MSYGSESAAAASNAGSAASTTASTMGEGASAVGAAGESGMYVNGIGQTQPSGFTLGQPTEVGQNYVQGADTTAYGQQVSDIATDKANLETYGTTDPSIWQYAGNGLKRFAKGKEQDVGEAWKNFGNNPETYGYVFGKAEGMTKGGGGGTQAPPVTLNNTYQQPENEYLRRYMMARRR